MVVVRLMIICGGYWLRGQEKISLYDGGYTAFICKNYCAAHLRFVHFTVCKVYLSNKVTKINKASNCKILVISTVWITLKLFYSVLFYRFFWISMIMKLSWALHWQKRVSTEEISHILDPQLLDLLLPMGCSGKRMGLPCRWKWQLGLNFPFKM